MLSDEFMVETTDLIGWTFEQDFSWICFSYDERHQTYFYDITDMSFPAVSDTVEFYAVYLPVAYSIAVEIIQR